MRGEGPIEPMVDAPRTPKGGTDARTSADGDARRERAAEAPRPPVALASDKTFRTLVAVAAVTTGVLVLAMALWRDAPFAFTFDDAYYYFGIARNVAEGRGSTFDGINLTNGYHPLWMLVSTVAFKAGLDDLDAARALLVLQVVVGWGGTLLLLSGIVSREIDGWSSVSRRDEEATRRARNLALFTLAGCFALVAVNPFIVKVFVNGLETGVLVVLLAGVLLVGGRSRRWWIDLSAVGDEGTRPAAMTGRTRIGLSVLLALCFLARTDAALLIACAFVWCLGEILRARPGFVAALTSLLQLFVVPVLTVAGYLLVNNSMFGTPWQVSGLVKRADLGTGTLVAFGVVCVLAALAGTRAFRTAHRRRRHRAELYRRFPHVDTFVTSTGWFAAYCILLTGYYVILQTQLWLWYFGPLVLYAIILLLLAIADMAEHALHQGRPGVPTSRQLLPLQAIFFGLLAAALVFEMVAFRDPFQLSIQQADRDMGVWLKEHTAPTDIGSSWDAGVVGYFSHRPVVNIDGLVNSYDYYQAARAGRGAEFLRCEGVAYVANHDDDNPEADRSYRDFIKELYGPAASEQATIAYEQPFLYSGTTTGSAGFRASRLRPMNASVYMIPAAARANQPPC